MRSAVAIAFLAAAGVARADAPVAADVQIAPYVQDVRSDGFTVVFETARDVAAETRVTERGERSERKRGNADPVARPGDVRVATHGTHHEAVLRGLPAGKRIQYAVTVDGHDIGGGEVALPDAARPLTFLVYGDTRNAGAVGVELARLAVAQNPDLVLYTGDISPWGSNEEGWLRFFADERALLADVPLYPTLGNHELFRDEGATHFRRFFALPDDGRDKLYYHFRFGNNEFIVLDGNAPSPAQTAWLSATLDAADAAHVDNVFVLVHQPPFSLGDHCGAALDQVEWLSLFERHHVRAVFAGHDHAYERMERRGVRYFVSGGGGAPVYREHECAAFDRAAKRVYRPVHHLLRVRVEGTNVEVTALAVADGAPIDRVRFAAGEPAFAMDAPPLSPAAAAHSGAPTWTYAGGAIIFLLLGLAVRRRRAR